MALGKLLDDMGRRKMVTKTKSMETHVLHDTQVQIKGFVDYMQKSIIDQLDYYERSTTCSENRSRLILEISKHPPHASLAQGRVHPQAHGFCHDDARPLHDLIAGLSEHDAKCELTAILPHIMHFRNAMATSTLNAILLKSGLESIASDNGRAGAKAKHASAPIQQIKATIKGLYDDWQSLSDPKQRYSGNAKFAAGMMDKYSDPTNDDTPQNQGVIERWCRAWKKERNNTHPA